MIREYTWQGPCIKYDVFSGAITGREGVHSNAHMPLWSFKVKSHAFEARCRMVYDNEMIKERS